MNGLVWNVSIIMLRHFFRLFSKGVSCFQVTYGSRYLFILRSDWFNFPYGLRDPFSLARLLLFYYSPPVPSSHVMFTSSSRERRAGVDP